MEALAPREQTALGGANAVLGQRAMLGERCHRPDLAVRLRIGPLSAAQHASFLPGAAASVQLQAMLRLFGQPLLRYDIVLVLRASDGAWRDPRWRAGGPGLRQLSRPLPARPAHRDDMHYGMHLMATLLDA